MTDETSLPAAVDRDDAPLPGREFPIPLRAFQATLRATPDEVWSHLLTLTCRGQNHTPTEWRAILADLQTQKV